MRKQRIGIDCFASMYLSSTIFHGLSPKLDSRRSRSSHALHFDQLLVVARAPNSVVLEEEQEADDDSDYEEESIAAFMEAKANDSAQEDRVPSHSLLPGALTT